MGTIGKAISAPEGWWVTPRKEEVPLEKPWLCLRTAMISSSTEMLPMHSVRSEYLMQHSPVSLHLLSFANTCSTPRQLFAASSVRTPIPEAVDRL